MDDLLESSRRRIPGHKVQSVRKQKLAISDGHCERTEASAARILVPDAKRAPVARFVRRMAANTLFHRIILSDNGFDIDWTDGQLLK
jgi:hypothetical protein